MKEVLQELAKARQGFVELRFHKRISNSFMAQKGRVDVANNSVTAGVGVRALVDGAWGFAATADLSKQAINRAIDQAQRNAKTLAKVRRKNQFKGYIQSNEHSYNTPQNSGIGKVFYNAVVIIKFFLLHVILYLVWIRGLVEGSVLVGSAVLSNRIRIDGV